MFEKNISQEFRLKDIDETRNYFIVERNQNELMSKKHKKVCTPLNDIEHLIILATVITGSVSTFASLVGIPIGILSRIKISATTAGIKKYKSIIKNKAEEE